MTYNIYTNLKLIIILFFSLFYAEYTKYNQQKSSVGNTPEKIFVFSTEEIFKNYSDYYINLINSNKYFHLKIKENNIMQFRFKIDYQTFISYR